MLLPGGPGHFLLALTGRGGPPVNPFFPYRHQTLWLRNASGGALALTVSSRILLAGSEREIEEADDDLDRVLAGKEMEVSTLIEDEILLSLPMVPRHDECSAVGAEEHKPRPSPFAALKKLKD